MNSITNYLRKFFQNLPNQPGLQFQLLTLVFVFFLSLGQIQRVQLTAQIAFYIHEIIMLIMWVFISAFINTADWKDFFTIKPWHKHPAKLFVLFLTIQTLIFSLFDFQIVSILYVARFFFYLSLYPLFTFAVKRTFLKRELLTNLLILISGAVALFGWIQYLLIPDTRFLYAYGWDDHYFRLISTIFDPGFTAIVIIIGFLLFLTTRESFNSVHRFLTIPLFLTAILLTYSRAGYLSFLTGLGVLFLYQKKLLPVALGIIFIALIPFLPRPDGEGVKLERTASIEARIESNQEAVQEMDMQSLLFGNGWYRNVQESETGKPDHANAPDNSFIAILYFTGVIGSILTIWSIGQILFANKNNPAVVAILASIVIHSMFNNSLFYIWVLAMGMMLLATKQGER